jgi:hypothetical protein
MHTSVSRQKHTCGGTELRSEVPLGQIEWLWERSRILQNGIYIRIKAAHEGFVVGQVMPSEERHHVWEGSERAITDARIEWSFHSLGLLER